MLVLINLIDGGKYDTGTNRNVETFVKWRRFAFVQPGRKGNRPLSDFARSLRKACCAESDRHIYSEAGKAYLHSQEQILEQQAKNERQQRFDNKISVLSVLIPLITFIIGVLIEHWVGLIDSFLSLFQ